MLKTNREEEEEEKKRKRRRRRRQMERRSCHTGMPMACWREYRYGPQASVAECHGDASHWPTLIQILNLIILKPHKWTIGILATKAKEDTLSK